MKRYCSVLVLFFSFITAYGQQTALTGPLNWYTLDPELDTIMGVGSERALKYLEGKEGREVIVAVIDSGVDIEHEDLKGHIWTNSDEIDGNGVDDDNNGYVDDVYGWNFIGGPEGNVKEDTHEMTREYVRLFSRYEGVKEEDVPENQLEEFEYWTKLKKNFEKIYNEAVQDYQFYYGLMESVVYFDSLFRAEWEMDELTSEALMDKDDDDSVTSLGKGILNFVFMATGGEQPLPQIIDELLSAEEHYRQQLEFTYNVNFDPREIVGDDYSNLFERYYGNSDVEGPDPSHGTGVASVIAADRTNGIGIKGVADNVKIMSIRTVPNGDERDKDVANAIRYAVDNGAHIINMSFGKSYTYGKIAVDSAVQYAMEKGVLLVHASGNESYDRDVKIRYPVKELENGLVADNWIEVGASSHLQDEDLPGSFSNYGLEYVDVFAPGVRVYTAKPNDSYGESDGTSFAAPIVSGVAALLMSYFPELNYKEIKEIIVSTTYQPKLMVNVPGLEGEQTLFSQLSISGGIVNAYKAVLKADTMTRNRR